MRTDTTDKLLIALIDTVNQAPPTAFPEIIKALDTFTRSYEKDKKTTREEIWVAYQGNYPSIDLFNDRESAKSFVLGLLKQGITTEPVGADGLKLSSKANEFRITVIPVQKEY